MTPPTLPLSHNARELVDFCLEFQTREGFIAEFERQYAKIQYSSRKKAGLKAAAYEATEQLYEQLLRRGRKYPDQENFYCALSKHRRKLNRESKVTLPTGKV